MNAMTMPDVKTAEAAPAYFSVRDIHSFYGESYIVQGVSFDVADAEEGLCRCGCCRGVGHRHRVHQCTPPR